MEPFSLHSDGLVLDPPTAADIDEVTRYCQDPLFERFMTLPWPYRRQDSEFFVEEFVPKGWSTGDELTWALRVAEGAPILGVLSVRANSTDIGFWLGAEHRGRGYMPDAVRLATGWVLETGFAGMSDIRWECVVGNASSAAVARKCGFRYEGVAPSRLVHRDGTHPPSWHAVLRASDDGTPRAGWPA